MGSAAVPSTILISFAVELEPDGKEAIMAVSLFG